MRREPVITNDGSHTIREIESGNTFHSHHGAVQESMHVFIEAGLRYWQQLHPGQSLHILEMGMGTGLNLLLTIREAALLKIKIHYTAIEAFPLEPTITNRLNYPEILQDPALTGILSEIHQSPWDTIIALTEWVEFKKLNTTLEDWQPAASFDIIYYDAFSPTEQPELWTTGIFEKLFKTLHPGGLLLTYCSKTIVRKAMMAAGFTVIKIQGPWGKRDMVRAMKPA